MELVRVFIAIELPDEVKRELGRVQGEIKRRRTSAVKWADPEGIHLTLKFLGNVPSGLVPEIASALAEATRAAEPFELTLGDLGGFPNSRVPRVAWVAVEGDRERLSHLQRSVELALVPLGFAREKRDFSPHLTLARTRERASVAERERLGEALGAVEMAPVAPMTVDSVSLMQSTLTPNGALYTRLAEARLGRSSR